MLRAGTKRKMIMPSSQANPIRKSPRKHLKDVVGTVENLDIKQQIVPTRKATKIRAQKAKTSTNRNTVLKETLKERDIGICQDISALIMVNMDILHEIAQKHTIRLILLKKVSKTRKSRICWIWTILA